MTSQTPINIDTLIDAWFIVTMNETRDIIHRGSVAVLKDKILDVGKTVELEKKYKNSLNKNNECIVKKCN